MLQRDKRVILFRSESEVGVVLGVVLGVGVEWLPLSFLIKRFSFLDFGKGGVDFLRVNF